MPILSQGGAVGTGATRGMNAFTLRELVKRRVPGYDDTEYLSEINDVYEELWQNIQQLDEMYFADITTLTVTQQSDQFDLVWNMYANLDASLPRLHQIHRIRIQQVGNPNMQPVGWRHMNDPEYLGRSTQQGQSARTNPSYLVNTFGEGTIKFAEPLPVGAKIEVVYTFNCMQLQILTQGQITTNGTVATGAGTFFTQMLPADMQSYLPNATAAVEANIEAEIVVNGKWYRVTEIDGDGQLVTALAMPTVQNAGYILAAVPEIPPSVHRIISTLATRNVLTTPADDPRFIVWAGKSEQALNTMKNTMIQRQRQEPPKKGRFPYGVTRRARFLGVK